VLRAAAASLDDVPRKASRWTGDTIPESARSFATSVGQNLETALPGFRQNVPEATDVLGRRAPNPQQGLGAIIPKVTTERTDPVISAYLDAGVDIGLPRQQVTPKAPGVTAAIPPIDLTPDEQEAWKKARGQKLIELTQPRLDDPRFGALPAASRSANLATILDAANRYADGVIQNQIGGAEISRRVRAGQQEKKAS
jgi:hypothetical protein